jgi:hypothetical protein
VGQFVLTGMPTPQSWRREKTVDRQPAVSLHIQSNPENKTEFAAVSPERYDILQERAGEKLTFYAAQHVRRAARSPITFLGVTGVAEAHPGSSCQLWFEGSATYLHDVNRWLVLTTARAPQVDRHRSLLP